MTDSTEFQITNNKIDVRSDVVQPSDSRSERTGSLLGGTRTEIKHGIDIPEHETPISQLEQVTDTMDVAVDLLQRLYGGLFILGQVFQHVPVEEKSSLMATAIDTQLLEPLIKVFPDMMDFNYTLHLDDNGTATVKGTNSFSKTLLYGIQQSLESPTGIKHVEPYYT